MILRYNTDLHVTPKFAVLAAGALGPEAHQLGLETQYVWRRTAGSWQRSEEVHFSASFSEPGLPIAIGIDAQLGGSINPEIGVGLSDTPLGEVGLKWGGDDLMAEVKGPEGSGIEFGAEFFGAGDYYVVASGRQYNQLGPIKIGREYVHPHARFTGIGQLSNTATAMRFMSQASNLIMRADQNISGTPLNFTYIPE